jgi:hypothetical protein
LYEAELVTWMKLNRAKSGNEGYIRGHSIPWQWGMGDAQTFWGISFPIRS